MIGENRLSSIASGGVILFPVVVSHECYQNFVIEQLRVHYNGGILSIVPKDWILITKLWITDLSATASFLKNQYSKFGPLPTDPACLLRSYLLMLLTRKSLSITNWVDELRRVPLYAILSGFEPHHTPGVGTFYDFFPRLWNLASPNIKPHKKFKRRKPKKKGKKKGEKAPTTSPGKVMKFVKRLLRYGTTKKSQAFDRLFDFFQSEFLAVSARLGLLGNLALLSVAGDGTPVITCALLRSKRLCDCRAQGIESCNHKRYFSQPDCDSGWDSSRERFFNGFHLYMLTAADSPHDLPLFPRLQPASRHDSLSLVVSSVEFSHRFTLGTINRIILDAAHDAMGIYLMLEHQSIEPFIDLNPRTVANLELSSDIKLSPKGIPICSANIEMKHNGFERAKERHKWRCPLMKGTVCSCSSPCSTAKYGRTFHTFLKDNPRLFPKIQRGSHEWKLIYNRRTAAERSNKREKVDYKLEDGRHRSTMMWYIRTYGIMMCQHIDAWYAHLHEKIDLQKAIFG